MSLTDRLRAIAEAADPAGSVILTVQWLRDQLDAEALARITNAGDSSTAVDLDVQQLADLFKRSTSTIRGWLAAGAFPNAYRLRRKEWRIPRGDVAALQLRERSQVNAAAPDNPDEAADLSAWRSQVRHG